MLDRQGSSKHAFDEWTGSRTAFHQTYIEVAHSSNALVYSTFLMNELSDEKLPLVLDIDVAHSSNSLWN
jgi:hypothetical protein